MLGVLGGYLLVFAARVCDVSMCTVRTLMVVRGKKFYAALIGFFEVIIYVLVLNKVFANLDNPLNIIFYAAGFATGNIVGGVIEEKLAVGVLTVQVITMKSPLELTEILRKQGYGVTLIEGQGREGVRYILQIILVRKMLCKLKKTIDDWDSHAFWTVFDARQTRGGVLLRKGK